MNPLVSTLFVLIVVILVSVAAGYLASHSRPDQPPISISITDELGEKTVEGFARAEVPRTFSFPADHGPHPDFRTEWWYFTGNLDDQHGRAFGFQLTFFRIALALRPTPSNSAWRTNQLYMAHFALTDVVGKRFYAHERFNRGALGLAGAETDTLHVWLDNWSADPQEPKGFPLQLQASEGEIAIDLLLEQGKPVVLQGNKGLSQKSAEPGNASYYYSITQLPTLGSVKIKGETFQVKGTSWLDREWSTSALGSNQIGWDWFALQLSDHRELMFYRLRRRDGSIDPFSAGTLIDADGSTRTLSDKDVHIEELDDWQSPRDDTVYPARWRLRVPKEDLDLDIHPLLADQELNVSVRYWEGAVTIHGTHKDLPITGRGYVELTGYASSIR